MNKIYSLLMTLLVSVALTAGAQTLIDEGFEDVPGNAATDQFPPDGRWSSSTPALI